MIHTLLSLLLAPLLRLLMRRPTALPRRILVIQVAKIGDVICTTPLLHELRHGLPQARITVLAASVTAPLLRANPNVDAVAMADPADWRGLAGKLRLAARLRREDFDAVLCCNGGAVWPSVALWARIPLRIGVLPNFAGRTQGLAGRLWTSGVQHRGDRLIVATYFDMLHSLGLTPVRSDKEVFAAAGARQRTAALLPDGAPLIGLAVSAANKLKELGSEKLAAVVKGILDSIPGSRIVLLGTAADASRAAAAAATLPPPDRPRIVDTCGRIALADLPELMAHLTAFVGVDSGLTYMADALSIPLVSVAGPCNMAETRPVNPRALILQKSLPCLPCAHIFKAPATCRVGTLACIRNITATEIVVAVRAALAEQSAQDHKIQ